MDYNPQKPVIVQSDRTILLEVQHPQFLHARDFLSSFAELVKSPEYIHSYRLSPLSIWNAAAGGMTASKMIEGLKTFSKFAIPQNITYEITELVARYGQLKLYQDDEGLLYLEAADKMLLLEIKNRPAVRQYLLHDLSDTRLAVDPQARGRLKQALIKANYPVEDLAGYAIGEPLQVPLRQHTLHGEGFALRDYQQQAIDAFYLHGTPQGGNGVIVLPCGAGKTVVGMGVMQAVASYTVIITTSIVAVRQWRSELLDKTELTEDMIGEYTGESKEIKPVTITTYQMLTWRKSTQSAFKHMEIFKQHNWGLIIYDEVHLLPAPVFRATTELQSLRRLGLTATLVREDGREDDVFSLIGPKRYDVPWHDLERQGWIAPASCYEVRVPMEEELRFQYAIATKRARYRLASENPAKIDIIKKLLVKHQKEQILIIGQYIRQLKEIALELDVPLITGSTPNSIRTDYYQQFQEGRISILVVSKVANFAIDLPEASVGIQVSGTYGSRQEEAQRLGRLLRPSKNQLQASFYTLVSRDSSEQEYALNRQLFLTEQGYRYYIVNAVELDLLLEMGGQTRGFE